jgi:hypothetical protein
MARQSYLDTSANYQNAKKGMKGAQIGGSQKDPDKMRNPLLGAILSSPTEENLYRRWGSNKDEKDTGLPAYQTTKLEDYMDEHRDDEIKPSKGRPFMTKAEIAALPAGFMEEFGTDAQRMKLDKAMAAKSSKAVKGSMTGDRAGYGDTTRAKVEDDPAQAEAMKTIEQQLVQLGKEVKQEQNFGRPGADRRSQAFYSPQHEQELRDQIEKMIDFYIQLAGGGNIVNRVDRQSNIKQVHGKEVSKPVHHAPKKEGAPKLDFELIKNSPEVKAAILKKREEQGSQKPQDKRDKTPAQ